MKKETLPIQYYGTQWFNLLSFYSSSVLAFPFDSTFILFSIQFFPFLIRNIGNSKSMEDNAYTKCFRTVDITNYNLISSIDMERFDQREMIFNFSFQYFSSLGTFKISASTKQIVILRCSREPTQCLWKERKCAGFMKLENKGFLFASPCSLCLPSKGVFI